MATATATRRSKAARPTLTEDEKRARLTALHDRLDAQVADLTNGEQWQAFLATAARFHTYSLNNVLLIQIQRPGATRVAGFHAWKDLGRSVRKGERGIQILAPVIAKTTAEDVFGDEVEERRVVGFRVVHVWDVSQTDGDPLPAPPAPRLLDGDVDPAIWDGLAALIEAQGYKVTRGDTGAANGWTQASAREVRVSDTLPAMAATKTLAHEAAHVLLGHGDDPLGYAACQGRAEVEAESVASVVLGALGIDTADYSPAYVASWAAGDTAVVKGTAGAVIRCSHEILEALDA